MGQLVLTTELNSMRSTHSFEAGVGPLSEPRWGGDTFLLGGRVDAIFASTISAEQEWWMRLASKFYICYNSTWMDAVNQFCLRSLAWYVMAKHRIACFLHKRDPSTRIDSYLIPDQSKGCCLQDVYCLSGFLVRLTAEQRAWWSIQSKLSDSSGFLLSCDSAINAIFSSVSVSFIQEISDTFCCRLNMYVHLLTPFVVSTVLCTCVATSFAVVACLWTPKQFKWEYWSVANNTRILHLRLCINHISLGFWHKGLEMKLNFINKIGSWTLAVCGWEAFSGRASALSVRTPSTLQNAARGVFEKTFGKEELSCL